MRRKLPIVFGAALGIIHFILVGIPFIQSGGGGEAIGYLVLFVDFPLYLLGELAFPKLLLNSVRFNFLWFVIMGTVMYSAIGYALGLLFNRSSGSKNSET
jgi:hypothetical protein